MSQYLRPPKYPRPSPQLRDSLTIYTAGCSAAWLARHVRDVEAGGSNPLTPTNNPLLRQRLNRRTVRCTSTVNKHEQTETTRDRTHKKSGRAETVKSNVDSFHSFLKPRVVGAIPAEGAS